MPKTTVDGQQLASLTRNPSVVGNKNKKNLTRL